MKRSITPAQRDELATLIEDARALNGAADRIRLRAEDITGDWEMNSHTFDACHNSTDVSVGELLKRLGVGVRHPSRARKARGRA